MRTLRLSRPTAFAARLARGEQGSVAVEFSLVALPFFLLIFATIELGMAMLATSTLDTATQIAARRVRTGEFQQASGDSKTDFKNLVCANMTWLAAKCAANAYVEVRTFDSFHDLAENSPMSGGKFNPSGTCFSPGAPTDIALVRVYFKWRLLLPGFETGMENMGDGSGMRLMSSATAFRNEPYTDQAAEGASC